MNSRFSRFSALRRRSLAAAALVLAAGPTLAQQQPADAAAAYPKAGQPIRYVVPFTPGGITDVMARWVAQGLAERWKANVVVENKPGGGAQIGADVVAKAPPDGHTLLAITLTHAANATLFRDKSPFNLQRDLKPVALLAGSPLLVVVPANSSIKTLADLQAQAKTKPLNAGSSGNGTPAHLALALFNDLNKTEVQHVPYKGGAPSIADLVSGQLDVVFSNLPESIAQVKAGKLRALAVASPQRHPLLPEVPTTAEAGQPQLVVDNWTALMVPAGTPDAIVKKIADDALKVIASAEVSERAQAQGFRLDPRGPDRFAQFLGHEVRRWSDVIRVAQITVD